MYKQQECARRSCSSCPLVIAPVNAEWPGGGANYAQYPIPYTDSFRCSSNLVTNCFASSPPRDNAIAPIIAWTHSTATVSIPD